jgi:hypothetical protein
MARAISARISAGPRHGKHAASSGRAASATSTGIRHSGRAAAMRDPGISGE